MSRINDALKQVQPAQSSRPPAGVPPLTPAGRRASGGIGWMMLLLIGLLLLGAGIFMGVAFFQKPAATAITAAPVGSPVPMVTPPKPVETAPVIARATPAKAIQKTNPPAAAAAGSVVPVAPAPLKLQGIMANPDRPSAIVNGLTVFVGDQVDHFRVKAIAPDSVTLENPNGSLKTLSLGE